MIVIDDDMEPVPSSGNLFRDHGLPNPDLEQARAILAGQILRVLDDDGLSPRQAHELTGVSEADFSRIRNVKLSRFTIDRLMTILNKLGRQVDSEFDVQRRPLPTTAPAQPGMA